MNFFTDKNASGKAQNTVLLGGTRGIGKALARELASRGHSLFLLGRNQVELDRTAADLNVRSSRGSAVGTAIVDLEQPQSFELGLEAALKTFGKLHNVIVTAGVFATQEKLELDSALAQKLLTVDFTNTVLFCEAAKRILLSHGGGNLCVFSSVAGERGRTPVVLYGATKAGLSAYLEGLDHKHHRDGLRVLTVKPGFVRTEMTSGLKEPPFAGDPEQVAKEVADALQSKVSVLYTPRTWQGVMMVIRQLPRAVMRRVKF